MHYSWVKKTTKPLERRQTKSNNRTIIFYYFHSLYVLLSSKNINALLERIRVSSNVRSTERKRVVWDWIMDRALVFNTLMMPSMNGYEFGGL